MKEKRFFDNKMMLFATGFYLIIFALLFAFGKIQFVDEVRIENFDDLNFKEFKESIIDTYLDNYCFEQYESNHSKSITLLSYSETNLNCRYYTLVTYGDGSQDYSMQVTTSESMPKTLNQIIEEFISR